MDCMEPCGREVGGQVWIVWSRVRVGATPGGVAMRGEALDAARGLKKDAQSLAPGWGGACTAFLSGGA